MLSEARCAPVVCAVTGRVIEAGGFPAFDPGDELRHELHGRRGIAVDRLSARAVIETGNHIEPAEGLRRGQPARLSDDGAVIVEASEGRNRLVRPAMVDDELAAIGGKRAQVRVGRIVDPAELLELLVHLRR